MQIKIALEWFINPDHLPFIAGVVTGEYKKAGLEVEIIEPKEHYDGFEQLKCADIDIHVNEPLHLYEHYFDGIKSLGCFFEPRGGVMIRKSSIDKLTTNQKIRITTPASNDVTDTIGFEIIKRYVQKNGYDIKRDNVEFIQTDFWHVNNMKKDASLDGAWLCFYNFEAIEAKMLGFENLFIDQFESPYPNFSALELMSSQSVIDAKAEHLCKFIEVTNKMVSLCKKDLVIAQSMYYDYTKQEKSVLMDNIIEDTLTRFEDDIKPDAQRWRSLYEFLEELDIVTLDDKQYDRIWK